MSDEKKELKKNEELCEGKQKLSIEDLENVTGGSDSDDYVDDNPLLVSD